MGCVTSKDKDPYLMVLDKYGEDKVKEFIIEVGKVQFIETNQTSILRALQDKI